MGTFTEEITLENNADRILANRGHLNESKIRTLKVEAMPDTGAWICSLIRCVKPWPERTAISLYTFCIKERRKNQAQRNEEWVRINK